MSYKPDETVIVSYLYGELSPTEMDKVERYFLDNPEELKKVEALKGMRSVLGALEDKEVIAPPIFLDDHTFIKPFWNSVYFKTIMSIAASLLLLMVAGKFLGTEINAANGELRISFGSKKQQPVTGKETPTLTPTDVQAMINQSLEKNNEVISTSWASSQEKLNQSVKNNLMVNSKKIDDLMKNTSQASQEQVKLFVSGLQNDNLKLMKDYLQLSSTEQKKYVENLLVDFSKYLQEQRNQDLKLFQTRVNSIEKNTDLFKQETEQIITSLISNSSVIKKQNSY
jgi:hypothetical protein